jgi:hypothetical protein
VSAICESLATIVSRSVPIVAFRNAGKITSVFIGVQTSS